MRLLPCYKCKASVTIEYDDYDEIFYVYHPESDGLICEVKCESGFFGDEWSAQFLAKKWNGMQVINKIYEIKKQLKSPTNDETKEQG